jgi:hypothetical protein
MDFNTAQETGGSQHRIIYIVVHSSRSEITPQLGQEKCMRFVRTTECHTFRAVGVLIFFYQYGLVVTGSLWDRILIWQHHMEANMLKVQNIFKSIYD